jgi:hypothetical protein
VSHVGASRFPETIIGNPEGGREKKITLSTFGLKE